MVTMESSNFKIQMSNQTQNPNDKLKMPTNLKYTKERPDSYQGKEA
jgi:hypothetical protein